MTVIVTLFERLHREGIPYCHWKSNEHLAKSMTGTADLDVLVDPRFALQLARALAELGFKRLLSGPGRGYPGIEDYLGFDGATGKLTHLHLHYRLTVGEKHLKGYRLPWESLALASRTLDPRFGLYVADPNLEMLLLLVRCAMKVRMRDVLTGRVGRPFLTGGALAEFRWLSDRVDGATLSRLAADLVGVNAERVVREILAAGRPTLRQLRQLRRVADPSWREFRMYRAWEAAPRRWAREARAQLRLLARRVERLTGRGAAHSCARTLPGGGLIAALVGPDGAGKSTVAAEVVRWLSREVAVVPLYGGSGAGPGSIFRLAIERIARFAKRVSRRRRRSAASAPPTSRRSEPAGTDTGPRDSTARALPYALWALSLAAERRRNAARARRARDRGQVAIADRYPQTQFHGLNDGPKLVAWSAHRMPLLRWAAARERSMYRSIDLSPPGLVVKLQLPPDVALQRKPDTPPERLRQKVKVVSLLRYPPGTRVIEVDATLPLEEVVLRVKRAVWESL